jgi:hypothetical protein
MADKPPIEFKAKKVIGPDGKESLSIQPFCETIIKEDGTQDVIVHMPSLSLINDFKKLNNIE